MTCGADVPPAQARRLHHNLRHCGNLVPREDAYQLVNLRVSLQECLSVALGQTTGDNHPPQPPLLFQPQ